MEDYAYRLPIRWWVFLLAGIIALVIALATVSLLAMKAAAANPVTSLRVGVTNGFAAVWKTGSLEV